jgi:hypothetical protein
MKCCDPSLLPLPCLRSREALSYCSGNSNVASFVPLQSDDSTGDSPAGRVASWRVMGLDDRRSPSEALSRPSGESEVERARERPAVRSHPPGALARGAEVGVESNAALS